MKDIKSAIQSRINELFFPSDVGNVDQDNTYKEECSDVVPDIFPVFQIEEEPEPAAPAPMEEPEPVFHSSLQDKKDVGLNDTPLTLSLRSDVAEYVITPLTQGEIS